MMSLSKDSGNTIEGMETDSGVAVENGRRRNFVRLMVVVVWDDRDDSLEAVLSVSFCCDANFDDCTATNFSSIAVRSLDEACVGGFPTDDEDDDEGDDDADDDELLSPLLPPRGRRRFIFFCFLLCFFFLLFLRFFFVFWCTTDILAGERTTASGLGAKSNNGAGGGGSSIDDR